MSRRAALCAYSLDLGLLLLGTGIGIESEGGQAGGFAFLKDLLLRIIGSHRAIVILGGLDGALLLELACRLFGRHVGLEPQLLQQHRS